MCHQAVPLTGLNPLKVQGSQISLLLLPCTTPIHHSIICMSLPVSFGTIFVVPMQPFNVHCFCSSKTQPTFRTGNLGSDCAHFFLPWMRSQVLKTYPWKTTIFTILTRKHSSRMRIACLCQPCVLQ